jgi:hypothetical protein
MNEVLGIGSSNNLYLCYNNKVNEHSNSFENVLNERINNKSNNINMNEEKQERSKFLQQLLNRNEGSKIRAGAFNINLNGNQPSYEYSLKRYYSE